MKISPREKFSSIMLMVLAVALMLGVSAINTQNSIYEWFFYGWLFIGTFLMLSVKCPNCGTSVAYKGRIFGFPLFASFASKRCKSCDYDLTASLPSNDKKR